MNTVLVIPDLPAGFPVLPEDLFGALVIEGVSFELHDDGPAVIFHSNEEKSDLFTHDLTRAGAYLSPLNSRGIMLYVRV